MKFFNFQRMLSLITIIFSLTGLSASFVLTVEILYVLRAPGAHLICSLNSVISCVSVMKTPQAEIFGFPNSLLGIVGYSLMLAVGVFMLFHKNLNKVIILLANLGALVAFLFSYWLLYNSVYVINALCIFCIISCISATNIFIALTLYDLKENNFSLKSKINEKVDRFLKKGWYVPIIVLWYVLVAALILMRFKESLFT